MTYKVRIVFDGVVVTGPPYPDQKGATRQGPFYAVMPLTTRQLNRQAKDDGQDWYIPVHFPVIAVRDSITLCDGGRPEDAVYKPCSPATTTPETPQQPEPPSFRLWYPMRERMEFAIDNVCTPGDLRYAYDDLSTAQEPEKWPDDKHYLHSITKVPRMRDIFQFRDRLRGAALAKRPRVIRTVAAQAFVPFGSVSGGADRGKRSNGVDAEFLPSRKDPPFPPHCQKIVPHVVVTVDVEKSIEIATFSLDSGKPLQTIKLRICQDEMIRVANADPENIPYVLNSLAFRDHQESDPRRAKPQFERIIKDIDFEALYAPLRGDDGEPMPIPTYDVRFGMRNCYGVMAEREPTGSGCLPLFGAKRR
jgi:hypothetical protein